MTVQSTIKNLLARRRRSHRQRGTILILAIAILAVLSLLAVSYVTVVRIDRDSSDAVAVSRDFDQQVGTVVRHIQSLLAADLFGNKIVTTSVPRYSADGLSLWPSMFEDGEFSDIDSIDLLYSRDWDPNPNSRILRPGTSAASSIAHPDDAWLASTEPRWASNGFGSQPYFKQFTNLRSAFTWDKQNQRWVRSDGLYVDLAQWFINRLDGRANAGINLLDPRAQEVTAVRGPMYSQGWYVKDQDNIDYARQMSELSPEGETTVLDPSDERFFVDTTGDLRPDAQWTQLEELGNLFGMVWVVGARITDASALVNLNTAIEAPAYGLNMGANNGRDYHEIVGTGETPADVDLVRLLTYDYGFTAPGNIYPNGVPNVNRILGDGFAFHEHLDRGRGVLDVLRALQSDGPAGLNPTHAGNGQRLDDDYQWRLNEPLTRNQRRYLYEQAYSLPGGGYARAQRYPERTMLDLHAFWGTNHATLISKPEQYLDGPANASGYLPPSGANGPLRSSEQAADIRSFGGGAGQGNTASPTLEQIEFDTRRLLTTASGTAVFSPVPVVNKDNVVTKYDGQYSRRQHNLSALRLADAPEIFADMVWALAPFATNKELTRPRSGTSLVTSRAGDADYHYGGGTDGPAQQFHELLRSSGGPGGTPGGGAGQIGAAYAIHRAGAFTVNLLDALDRNQNDPARERPSVLRFFPKTELPTQLPRGVGYPVAYTGTRFAHGDIDSLNAISAQYIGEDDGGISFIGVDRQPFLVEAHTLAVYQGAQIAETVTIQPDSVRNQVGSIVAFELANPWPDPIRVGSGAGGVGGGIGGGYVIRVLRDESWLEFRLPGSAVIPAGGRGVFYWASESGENGFAEFIMEDILEGWLATVAEQATEPLEIFEIGRGTEEGGISNHIHGGGGSPVAVVFQNMATSMSGHTQVQLIRLVDDPVPGAQLPPIPLHERKGDLLVDRMTTNSLSTASGSGILWDDFFGALRDTRTETFVGAPDERVRGNFRVTVLGNMHRAPRRPAGQGGFPAYVVEKPAFNRIHVEGHGPAGVGGSGEAYIQRWLVGEAAGGGDTDPGDGAGGGEGDVNDPLAGPTPVDDLWAPGDALRLANDTARPEFQNLPEFQLFNPSARFSSVSDVAMVSAFSHMYLHDAGGTANEYSIIRVNEISTRYNDDVPGFNINDTDGGRWLTFSEQLGFDFHLDGDPTTVGTFEANPWFGKIDPTRYRFGGNLAAAAGLPESLSVPLGSRMFDLFTAVDGQDFLLPGTVNINTAPPRVLSALPLVEPLQPVSDGSTPSITLQPTPPASGSGNANSRAAKLYDYRERKGMFGPNYRVIQQWTGLPGLREVVASTEEAGENGARGFVSKGEIPLIGQFNQTTGLPEQQNVGTFLELAANPLNATAPPFETWSDRGLPLSFGPTQTKAYAEPTFNPASDAEEQLALFRAISNIVSTRSDVFMATFVLRGYDPDVIESIEVPGDPLEAMNDPRFRPAYESRWLVVFDRSNVRTPTDRPRILLRMELPSAVP